ncbi:hypothetical protein AYJ54_07850 [Bradyrhizobium centrolobii]|uniref:Uncharacterized protein n=1 Tax=Bradyrhizobium centrolobii TaxID=1505087 RepID=A0A176YX42_9BRAD|nr:hypothetical protein [Bradyrhizobium centrolobii]OAF11764.1 hypothetical protein AYJ54_07850 [Bradyrhizobium centrolobii]
MGWSARFDDPIALPDGRKLETLRDAGEYIAGLPKVMHDAPEWQAAMEALILVAELGGPTMFARIGFMRALNRGKPNPQVAPRRKPVKAYRLIR